MQRYHLIHLHHLIDEHFGVDFYIYPTKLVPSFALSLSLACLFLILK